MSTTVVLREQDLVRQAPRWINGPAHTASGTDAGGAIARSMNRPTLPCAAAERLEALRWLHLGSRIWGAENRF